MYTNKVWAMFVAKSIT
jgi:hypothetical protein